MFLNLDFIPVEQLQQVAVDIKETVEMWTGIKVSVGIAATKVLAKAANKLSKKNKQNSGCVMVLDSKLKIEQALRQTNICDVWGIGYQYAEKLKKFGVQTAFDLTLKPIDFARIHLGGVIGLRLWRELKGITSMNLDDELINKKMIATTRMFGEPVTDLKSIKEAIATYTSRAAEKLRRQHCAAKYISVFIVAKEQNHNATFKRGATISSYTTLNLATSKTHELIKPALEIAERLFEQGRSYKKAGVMLGDIVPDQSIQGNLFLSDTKNRGKLLMNVIDNINFSQRNDIVKFASSGTTRNWKMQQNFHSLKYTSRWEDLCEVK
jgi:DNA polymerase V